MSDNQSQSGGPSEMPTPASRDASGAPAETAATKLAPVADASGVAAPDFDAAHQEPHHPGDGTSSNPAPATASGGGAPIVAATPAPAAPAKSPASPAAAPASAGSADPRGPQLARPRRVFTHQELWSTISNQQRRHWARRAGIVGDLEVNKRAELDWHQLDGKTQARLKGVR